MGDFLAALLNPAFPFLRNALFMGILSAPVFGITGTWVVIRRISSIAGAIAHTVLGGIGIALWLKYKTGWEFLQPIHGAYAAAIAAAIIIGAIRIHSREREDTVIGALWALGMATGILMISRTPGYVDLMSYMFGNILIISESDLIMVAILDIVIIVTALLFHRQLLTLAFDEDFARARGMAVRFYTYLLFLMIALTVVLLVTVVGIIMVIALLTLPATLASMITRRAGWVMIVSTGLIMLLTSTGLVLGWIWDLPTGSLTIVLTGGVYLVALVVRGINKRGSNVTG